MPYKLVVFDWDGTLMDSADKIIASMQDAAMACGVMVPTADEVSHIIGISLEPAIRQLFSLTDQDPTALDIVREYKKAYQLRDRAPCKLFNGVERLLTELRQRNCLLAVATGKARVGLERAWQTSNTGQFFQYSCCADEAHSKPSPDMLLKILSRAGLTAAEAVMVGDTTYDMQMAQAIGMHRVGVSYGVHAAVNLQHHKPQTIVSDVDALSAWLLQHT